MVSGAGSAKPSWVARREWGEAERPGSTQCRVPYWRVGDERCRGGAEPRAAPGLTPGNTEHRVLFGVTYGDAGIGARRGGCASGYGGTLVSLSVDEQRAIRVPAAWLRTVVVRRCLDLMKGQARQRERYRGIWLPEPRLSPEGASQNTPAEAVERPRAVSFALVLAMETLTPVERVSFVLHESFGVPFVEIAETVGRSVSRAGKPHARPESAWRVRGSSPQTSKHENARAAFVLASATGNLDALIGILDPSARVRSDGGASVKAALRPIVGADRVAGYLLGLLAIQRTQRDGLRFSLPSERTAWATDPRQRWDHRRHRYRGLGAEDP